MPLALCTLADLKAFLGIAADDNASDARLTELITTASGQIAGYCGREFEIVAVANELHDGDGTDELRVDLTPIVSVSALSIDGEAVDVAELAIYHTMVAFKASGEYSPRLRSYGQVFPVGRQNVSISYSAGYAAVPRDIQDACKLQVAFLTNTIGKQGVLSESNKNAQAFTSYTHALLSPAVRTICARYRRNRIGVV